MATNLSHTLQFISFDVHFIHGSPREGHSRPTQPTLFLLAPPPAPPPAADRLGSGDRLSGAFGASAKRGEASVDGSRGVAF